MLRIFQMHNSPYLVEIQILNSRWEEVITEKQLFSPEIIQMKKVPATLV